MYLVLGGVITANTGTQNLMQPVTIADFQDRVFVCLIEESARPLFTNTSQMAVHILLES